MSQNIEISRNARKKMDKDTLLKGESKTLEFKAALSDSYLKTVVAFANTDGGRLVFGIDDKTEPMKKIL